MRAAFIGITVFIRFALPGLVDRVPVCHPADWQVGEDGQRSVTVICTAEANDPSLAIVVGAMELPVSIMIVKDPKHWLTADYTGGCKGRGVDR